MHNFKQSKNVTISFKLPLSVHQEFHETSFKKFCIEAKRFTGKFKIYQFVYIQKLKIAIFTECVQKAIFSNDSLPKENVHCNQPHG